MTPAELTELTALADGTLDASRRPEVEARIAASPELRELFEREQRVVDLIHQVRASDRAPARLRARIEAERPRRVSRARRRVGYVGAIAGGLAAAALVVALALPGGTPGAPSVSQAAGLALRGPSQPAPAVNASRPLTLTTNLQDVYFPNWAKYLGWKAVGARADRLGGRAAVTIYYDAHGTQVAYTIVGAPALAEPHGQVTQMNGYALRTLTLNGRTVVTWRRAGLTCVLSAVGVRTSVLRDLAAWRGPKTTD